MPFSPRDPHIAAAIVLGKQFWQFGDPLDWLAQQFGIEAKVDRIELMESLSLLRQGGAGINQAAGEAMGSDKRTRFRMQVFGRCENRLVALAAMTVSPYRFTLDKIEEICTTLAVMHADIVLGFQATQGLREGLADGVELDERLIRLLPVNVFNRSFFQEKIELLERDKKVRVTDAVTAAMVRINAPVLFYDVPMKGRKKKAIKMLPF